MPSYHLPKLSRQADEQRRFRRVHNLFLVPSENFRKEDCQFSCAVFLLPEIANVKQTSCCRFISFLNETYTRRHRIYVSLKNSPILLQAGLMFPESFLFFDKFPH